MATQPRMSAPIARVRIKTRNKKVASGQCWRAADPPLEEQLDAEDVDSGPEPPRFYPFAPRARRDRKD